MNLNSQISWQLTFGQQSRRTNFLRGSWLRILAAFLGMVCAQGALQAQQVATPVLVPSSAFGATPFLVTVSCSTAGAIIYYTTDGTDPAVTNAQVASGSPVTVSRNLTLKAKAFASGMTPSLIASATYNVTGAIDGGAGFSLALKSNGTLWSWGAQGAGRLANGSVASGKIYDEPTPVLSKLPLPSGAIKELAGVVEASAGYAFGVAADSAGAVWAWGDNVNGTLGTNDVVDFAYARRVLKNNVAYSAALEANGDFLSNISAVSAGYAHSVAVDRTTGEVWAWGAQTSGRLGNGNTSGAQKFAGQVLTTVPQTAPLTGFVPLSGMVQVSAGKAFTLALGNLDSQGRGQVWAWGDNTYGQIAQGTASATPFSKAVKVKLNSAGALLNDVTEIAAGDNHALVIRRDTAGTNTVWAWGGQANGRLGNGQTGSANITYPGGNSATPTTFGPVKKADLSVLDGIIQVSAGPRHSSALESLGRGGKVYTWGYNTYGALGHDGVTQMAYANTVKLPSGNVLDRIVAISAGGYEYSSTDVNGVTTTYVYSYTLALREDGTLYGWGYNINGEIGDATIISKSSATVSPYLRKFSNQVPIIGPLSVTTGSPSAEGPYIESSELTLSTTVSDPDTDPLTIRFYEGGTLLGTVASPTNSLAIGPRMAGTYNFKAIVSDQNGETASTNTSITVRKPLVYFATPEQSVYEYNPAGAEIRVYRDNALNVPLTVSYNVSGTATNGVDYQTLSGSVVIPANASSALIPITLIPDNVNEGDEIVTLTIVDTTNYDLGNLTASSLTILHFPLAATPVFEPESAIGPLPFLVKITCANAGSMISYTTDGTEPLPSGPQIPSGGTVKVSRNLTLKAKAYAGNASASLTATATYKVTGTLDAGAAFAVGLKSNGSLWSWGAQSSGRLGNGSVASAKIYLDATPVLSKDAFGTINALTGVVETSAGYAFGLAADSAGRVWAWGDNANGTLGSNDVADSAYARRVLKNNVVYSAAVDADFLTNVSAVSAGYAHSVAVDRTTGGVWAWGAQTSGRLGNGLTSGAQKFAGSVLTTVPQTAPLTGFVPLSGMMQVAAGKAFTLALGNFDSKGRGQVWAWGDNTYGQIGQGTASSTPLSKAVKVQLNSPGMFLNDVIDIAVGDNHALVIRQDAAGTNTVWAWGLQSNGRLGNGQTGAGNISFPGGSSTAPTVFGPVKKADLTGLDGIIQVSAGPRHSAALESLARGGKVYTWGYNQYGALGHDGTTQTAFASTVKLPNGDPLDRVIAISAGGYESTVTDVNGVSTNYLYSFTLALREDGLLYGWGYNVNGEIGDGTLVSKPSATASIFPTKLGNQAPVLEKLSVYAGSRYTEGPYIESAPLTLVANVSDPDRDPLTIRFYEDQTLLGQVALPGINNLSIGTRPAGTYHFTVVVSDPTGETVSASNTVTIIKPIGSSTGQSIKPLFKRPSMLVNGGTHSLALRLDGTVWAWGQNTYGQLGLGAAAGTADRDTPQLIKFFNDPANPGAGDRRVVAVAAGASHSMALTEDGAVYVWGRNNFGQIGNGTAVSTGTGSMFSDPQLVQDYQLIRTVSGTSGYYPVGSPPIRHIAAGANHCLVSTEPLSSRLMPGSPMSPSYNWEVRGWLYLFGWGKNDHGQLGNGGLVNQTKPSNCSFEIMQSAEVVGGITISYQGSDVLGLTAGANHSAISLRHYGGGRANQFTVSDCGDDTYRQIFSGNWYGDGSAQTYFGQRYYSNFPLSVHAGANHTFAFNSGNYGYPLQGTGQNAQGQIGTGYFNGVFAATPTYAQGSPYELYDSSLYGLWGVRQLAVGANHNLALMEDGKVYVWGNNKSGTTTIHALGLGADINPILAGVQYPDDYSENQNKPRLNPFISDVAYVAAGGNSSFAVLRNGAVYAWGANADGSLGVGGVATVAAPKALFGAFSLWTDTDNDGLPDEWEIFYWGNLSKTGDEDFDQDGLSNRLEWQFGSNPTTSDTDGDLFQDAYEFAQPLFDPVSYDQSVADYDADGLSNLLELVYKTNPGAADSDGDGVNDGAEVAAGSNPSSGLDGGVPPPATELMGVTLTVGDYSGSHSERYNLVVRDATGEEVLTHQAPNFGEVATASYKLRRGRTYSFEIVHTGTEPGFLEANEGKTDYDWEAGVAIATGGEGYEVEDPDGILGQHDNGEFANPDIFNAAGKRVYLRIKEAPEPCAQQASMSSVSEASGPSHRKIALNGLPMPDSKPQAKEETDVEHEETYIDALTQQLRHSTTDVYVPLVGDGLTLSARRDSVPEVWGTHPGLSPDFYVNRPFGLGWSTNLCTHIQFVYRIQNSPPSNCVSERPEPDTAIVTDENGSTHRFLRIWDTRDPQNPKQAFLPYPSNRNEGESFLTELTINADSSYTFRKKFGTTVQFAPVDLGLSQSFPTSATANPDRIVYTYSRATSAADRLGNKLSYRYEDGSLVPREITANGNRSILVTKDAGPQGVIRSITDPRQNVTQFGYTTKTYADPYRGNISYKVLSTVTTAENTVSQYGYEAVGREWDWTPYDSANPPPRWEYFFHSNLNSITNPSGRATLLSYATDGSRHSYSSWISGYYSVPGQPRIVTKVTFPLLAGQTTAASASFTSYSDVRVAYAGDPVKPTLRGQRKLQVTDAEGFNRYYDFLAPSIVEQDEFENLLFNNNDNRTTPFLVLYTQLAITHPTGVQEVFDFEPTAGMAISKVRDYSGNITQYLHEDAWSIRQHQSLTWIPDSYYAHSYGDPTQQINALNKSRSFTYNSERILTKVVDEENQRIQYEVQPVTGLRTRESIFSATGTLLQETQFEYGHPQAPQYPAFLRRKTVLRHAADPAWAENLVTEFVPDQFGYVAEERVWEGTKWLISTFKYDANGNREESKDPRGNITSFNFDKLNRLKTVTVPTTAGLVAPVTKSFGYDLSGNKLTEKDENGNLTIWGYDEWNRAIQQVRDINGNALVDSTVDLITTYGYNKLGSRTTVKDSLGYITTTSFDQLQRPYRILDPLNNLSQMVYGANAGSSAFDVSGFKPTKTIDARGYSTDITYDALYRPILKSVQIQKAPLPVTYAVMETEYNQVGDPLRVWDPLNPKGGAQSHAIVSVFDALHRVTKITHQDQNFTLTRYTTTGLTWQTEDERGLVADFQFDGASRSRKSFSPLVPDEAGVQKRAITETVYDDAGNVAQTINPLGKVWDNVFDARNRKTDEYGPEVFDGDTGTRVRPRTQWGYDAVGNQNKLTDSRGAVTDFRFDRANRVYEMEGPAVMTPTGLLARPLTKTFYDRNGKVTSIDDPNRIVTNNTYDQLGRLSTTRDALANTVIYGYDAVGNRTSVKDGKLQITAFEFDGLNRLVKTTDPLSRAVKFEYDGLNKTARVDAQGRRTSYGYDPRHRVKTINYFNATGAVVNDATNASRTYNYDAAGNLLSVVEPTKGVIADVGYTYDGLNRVLTETSRGLTHTYRYDLVGNRRWVTYGGSNRQIEQTYDEVNRLSSVIEGGRTTTYKYDLNGNTLTELLPNQDLTVNVYDALNRMSSTVARNAGGTLLQKFDQVFDLVGNLRKVTETYGDATRNRTRDLLVDGANRLKEEKVTLANATVETTTYVYDAAHNRSSKVVTGGATPGTTSYVLNSLNQVTSVSGPGLSQSFLYDLDGNRTSRSGTGGGGAATYGYDLENRLISLSQGGVSYVYAYDYRTRRVTRTEAGAQTAVSFSGGLSALEQVAGVTTAEFLRGDDLGGGGVGGMLYSLRSGTFRFFHDNGRGDVVAQSDGAGALTWQASYEAFGRRQLEVGSSTDRQRANTKEEDPSGLLNEGFRYRDLELGVFINRDPAGFVDGPNLYTYVRQNPWSKFDPEGLNDTTGWQETGMGWIADGFVNSVIDAFVPDPVASNHSISNSAQRAGDINAGAVDRVSAGVESVASTILGVIDVVPVVGKFGKGARNVAKLLRRAETVAAHTAEKEIVKASKAIDKSAQSTLEQTIAQAEKEAPTGLCFLSGTLVATVGGQQAIESLNLGDRVLTTDERKQDSSTDVDPATWRAIHLHLPNPDGSNDVLKFDVLRSLAWIDTVGAETGASIWFELAEMGIAGWATVDGIQPCPPIAEGAGRVVLATMTHLNGHVLQLYFDGAYEILSPTDTHRLYSETHQAWLPAGELQPGEVLRTQGGEVQLVAVENFPGIHQVFNIQVETEHCYFVGGLRVLSHNANPCAAAGDSTANSATANRVKLRKGTRAEVEANQPRGPKGELLDPNTGEALKPGAIDVGHKPGNEWKSRKKMHEEKGSTRKEVIEAENDSDLYHLEDRSSNRGHKYEQK